MAYEDNQVYAKYLAEEIKSEGGCSECEGASKCGCCPIGLVAVYNTDGVQVACLTPADAQEYETNNKSCKEGFIALYKNSVDPPLFMGCVSEDSFETLYPIVNP